jgi:amidase
MVQMTEGAYSDHHFSVTPPKNPWNPDYGADEKRMAGSVSSRANNLVIGNFLTT